MWAHRVERAELSEPRQPSAAAEPIIAPRFAAKVDPPTYFQDLRAAASSDTADTADTAGTNRNSASRRGRICYTREDSSSSDSDNDDELVDWASQRHKAKHGSKPRTPHRADSRSARPPVRGRQRQPEDSTRGTKPVVAAAVDEDAMAEAKRCDDEHRLRAEQ